MENFVIQVLITSIPLYLLWFVCRLLLGKHRIPTVTLGALTLLLAVPFGLKFMLDFVSPVVLPYM
jgi:hypothetical protein